MNTTTKEHRLIWQNQAPENNPDDAQSAPQANEEPLTTEELRAKEAALAAAREARLKQEENDNDAAGDPDAQFDEATASADANSDGLPDENSKKTAEPEKPKGVVSLLTKVGVSEVDATELMNHIGKREYGKAFAKGFAVLQSALNGIGNKIANTFKGAAAPFLSMFPSLNKLAGPERLAFYNKLDALRVEGFTFVEVDPTTGESKPIEELDSTLVLNAYHSRYANKNVSVEKYLDVFTDKLRLEPNKQITTADITRIAGSLGDIAPDVTPPAPPVVAQTPAATPPVAPTGAPPVAPTGAPAAPVVPTVAPAAATVPPAPAV